MKILLSIGLLLTLRTVVSSQVAKDDDKPSVRWEQDVTLEQFRQGFVFDSDLIFLYEVNETSPGCPMVPNNEIGIALEVSQFMVEWKAIAKHAVVDPDSYSYIQELEGNAVTTTAILDVQTLVSYDLVLWKHDAVIGDGDRTKESMYRIVDASPGMRPGTLYTFYWNRDDLQAGEADF